MSVLLKPVPGSIDPWVDVRSYSSINAAVTAIGSTQTTLVVPNAQTLIANLTIPPTLSLIILKGGSIVKASTYTLTINGPFDAGLYQVFSGFAAGDVAFSSGSVNEIYPEWWGAKGDGATDDSTAVLATIASIPTLAGATFGVVPKLKFISGKTYVISQTLTMKQFMTIEMYGAKLKYTGNGIFLNYVYDGTATIMYTNTLGGVLEIVTDSANVKAIHLDGARWNRFRDVVIRGTSYLTLSTAIDITSVNGDNYLNNFDIQIFRMGWAIKANATTNNITANTFNGDIFLNQNGISLQGAIANQFNFSNYECYLGNQIWLELKDSATYGGSVENEFNIMRYETHETDFSKLTFTYEPLSIANRFVLGQNAYG